MADTRIMIVVGDREAGDAYAEAVGKTAASYDIVPSFNEMATLALSKRYNGLIIDVLTLVRCSREEKILAYDSINHFPVLRVKWDHRQKRISLAPLEHHGAQGVDSVLRSFVESRCSSFTARTLRRHKRREIHLNLLLSRDPCFPDQERERSFTATLSMGGAFVHTMRDFAEKETVWLRFLELSQAVEVRTRWSLKWGVSRGIPGIGVSFESLSPEQEKEIERVLR